MNESPGQVAQKRMGATMLTLMWILFLLLLMYLFDGFLANKSPPIPEPMTVTNTTNSPEVRLQRTREGHYLSTGAINGSPVIFLLDTGATHVVIPLHIANRLGLEAGQTNHSITANGTVTTYATELDRISIGTIELRHISAAINPNTHEDVILLGMTFLKHLEFSQRGDTLTLKP